MSTCLPSPSIIVDIEYYPFLPAVISNNHKVKAVFKEEMEEMEWNGNKNVNKMRGPKAMSTDSKQIQIPERSHHRRPDLVPQH